MHTSGGICPFPSKLLCFILSKHFVEGRLSVPEKLWYRKLLAIRGGFRGFPFKLFCLLVPNHFVEESLGVSKEFGIENCYDKRWGGYHNFPSKIVVSQYQNISQRNPSMFQKILVTSKKFMPRSGISRSYIENLLSHSKQTFWENHCMFHKNFGVKKFDGYEGRESLFSVQVVVSHNTETFRGRTLVCSKKLWYRKMLAIRWGGGDRGFPSKLFCHLIPKHFVEESFCVSKNSGIEDCYDKRRGG